ncbi:Ctr copper transporter family-domain-containing protein [Whalleya microplaca]|nr:Ctr copper transporter family-domain-containing protein [Whalleya microplaca]
MDMTMTSGMSGTMTMATASSTSTSTADGGMDMDSSTMMMTSADMAMTFFSAVTTPLYSSSWTPSGTGTYAGTCIFLIALALTHRVLLAMRFLLFDSNPALHRHRHQHHKVLSEDGADYDGSSGRAELMGRHVREQWNSHPFRVATETMRAVLEVVIGGVGYLLMLAVMTMNVGYFLSVLGGIFLGAFVMGRFGASDIHH